MAWVGGGGACLTVRFGGCRYYVKFGVTVDDEFTESLRVCGSSVALGEMDPAKGVTLMLVRGRPSRSVPSPTAQVVGAGQRSRAQYSPPLPINWELPMPHDTTCESLAIVRQLPADAPDTWRGAHRSKIRWATTGRPCARSSSTSRVRWSTSTPCARWMEPSCAGSPSRATGPSTSSVRSHCAPTLSHGRRAHQLERRVV